MVHAYGIVYVVRMVSLTDTDPRRVLLTTPLPAFPLFARAACRAKAFAPSAASTLITCPRAYGV
jgi:hypothetical protein